MFSRFWIFIYGLYSLGLTFGSSVILKTKLGKIKGQLVENSGQWGEVYESIPYAKPTSDQRRFETPEPLDKWTDELDVRNASTCYKYHDEENDEFVMPSDDCLRFKLVIPLDTHKKRYTEKLPLIFWIHGGSYQIGGKYYYKTSGILRNIASKKIIFAAVDYRLGFQGFLSAKDQDLPGNLALEDVLLALNSLRDNHESIGFDLENIVVAGESAGSSMAGLVAVSPRFKGLIHGAMMFSGTPTGSWAVRNKHTVTNSMTVFKHCNCSRNTSKEIKECMKKAPIKCHTTDLIPSFFADSFSGNHSYTYEGMRMGMTLFTPIVDTHRGEKAFLPEQPEIFVKKTAHLPVLISNTAHERLSHLLSIADYSKTHSLSVNLWVELLVPARYNASSTVKLLLKERYTKELTDNKHSIGLQFHHMAQEEWTSEAHHEALLYADRNATVYTILTDVFHEPLGGAEGKHCTDHGTDLAMLFDSRALTGMEGNFSDDQLKWGRNFAEKLSKTIADFVYTKKLDFPKFTRANRALTRITNRTIEYQHFDSEAYYFWKQLIPTLARFNLHLVKN